METYLVYVDAANNNNKFWSAKVEGNQLTVQWGRVGYQAQNKVHSFNSYGQATLKYHNLVAGKKSKGYRESQPQIDTSCDIQEILRAIELLDIIRRHVEQKNFNTTYINSLNQYLKIVPTPLGMQIEPYRIYSTVADVDYQIQLLNSLLPNNSVVSDTSQVKAENQKVSLRTISKNFWRHL